MSVPYAPMLMSLFFIAAIHIAPADAQTAGTTGIVATFKGTAANLERVAGETITVDIRRWSTDEDRAKLLAAFSQGVQQAADSMQKAESIGYLWRSGSGLGQSIRHALEAKLPDGRQRVILVTTDNLSEWNRRPGPTPAEPAAPLTVIELRLPATGPGEGKFSSKIGVDAASKLLTIEGYEAAPVVFKGVTRTKK